MKFKETKIGTIISTDLPQVSNYLFSIGYDFIFIDLEHGNVSDITISSILSTKRKDSQVFIRIREISEFAIKHALDLGCDGIIAPKVESSNEIQCLVEYSFFPPLGKRSLGFCPANDFGTNLKGYLNNFKPILLPQVESIQGLRIAKELILNDKVSGILMGPYDLSLSLEIPGEFTNPLFTQAYESIRKLCFENNKYFCTFALNNQSAQEEIDKGVHYITVGIDLNMFLNNYIQSIKTLKG